jgi:hypothetical protein
VFFFFLLVRLGTRCLGQGVCMATSCTEKIDWELSLLGALMYCSSIIRELGSCVS